MGNRVPEEAPDRGVGEGKLGLYVERLQYFLKFSLNPLSLILCEARYFSVLDTVQMLTQEIPPSPAVGAKRVRLASRGCQGAPGWGQRDVETGRR